MTSNQPVSSFGGLRRPLYHKTGVQAGYAGYATRRRSIPPMRRSSASMRCPSAAMLGIAIAGRDGLNGVSRRARRVEGVEGASAGSSIVADSFEAAGGGLDPNRRSR
jgi:hypothetical protein